MSIYVEDSHWESMGRFKVTVMNTLDEDTAIEVAQDELPAGMNTGDIHSTRAISFDATDEFPDHVEVTLTIVIPEDDRFEN